jgi:hypothetical protein
LGCQEEWQQGLTSLTQSATFEARQIRRTQSSVEYGVSTAEASPCGSSSRKALEESGLFVQSMAARRLPFFAVRSIVTAGRKGQVNRIRTATVAALLASFVGLQPAPAMAQPREHRDHSEDRWDHRHDRWDRREDRRDRRDDRRGRHEDRRDRRDDRYDARNGYWDPARYYRGDNRGYGARRLDRNDRIYRGSDNRYYCRRDDGTTGLIIGGISGGVLGHIIAPGGSKTLGTIIGAGAGALIGRAIDDGDVVCR